MAVVTKVSSPKAKEQSNRTAIPAFVINKPLLMGLAVGLAHLTPLVLGVDTLPTNQVFPLFFDLFLIVPLVALPMPPKVQRGTLVTLIIIQMVD